MKNYNKICLLFIFTTIVSVSCDFESDLPEQNQGKFSSEKLEDEGEISRLRSFFESSEGRVETEFYNWDETSRVIIEDEDISVYAVPEMSDENNILGIFETPEGSMAAVKIITTVEAGVAKLNYVTLNDKHLVTVIADSNTESFSFSYPSGDTDGRIECGQATIDCVVDSYENLGWASVGLFVATLITPQVGAAVAALCAVEECIFS